MSEVKQYRPRHHYVEAICWDGLDETREAIKEFYSSNPKFIKFVNKDTETKFLDLGVLGILKPGYWLVRNENGGFEIMSHIMFKNRYELDLSERGV